MYNICCCFYALLLNRFLTTCIDCCLVHCFSLFSSQIVTIFFKVLFAFPFLIKQSQAKFSMERAREALDWVEAVLDRQLNYPQPAEGLRDQLDFAHALKDGITLCE